MTATKPKIAKKSKSNSIEQVMAEMRGNNLYATADQVATLIGQHRATVYRRVKDGTIPAVVVGDAVRISWDVVEKLVRGQPLTA